MIRFLWIAALTPTIALSAIVPERRPNPAHKNFGYVLYPIAAKAPGLDWSYGGGVMINNVLNPDARLIVLGTTGSIRAAAISLTNLDVIPEVLRLEANVYDSVAPRKIFDRGMDSLGTTYNTELIHEVGGGGGLTFTLWQRRISLTSRYGTNRYQTQRVLHQSGREFRNADQENLPNVYSRNVFRLDFTDDWNDPTKGLRLEASRHDLSITDPNRSKFHHWNYSATAYIPVFATSTWAFNYFRSAAYLNEAATATPAEMNANLDLGCSQYTDPEVLAQCNESQTRRNNHRTAENRFGSAGYLGGTERLRSFSIRRFEGSETIFYGTEFRWNISSQSSEVDWGFARGTRSGVQLALFAETGAVADPPVDIYSAPLQNTFGAGLRLILSGAVLRIEVAQGREGSEAILFYGYPWGNTIF